MPNDKPEPKHEPVGGELPGPSSMQEPVGGQIPGPAARFEGTRKIPSKGDQ